MDKSQVKKEEIQVKIKTIKYYFTKEDGMVIIYHVRTDDMDILDSFYLVTFDDTSLEVVWGVGPTPEAALKDAQRKWDLDSKEEEKKDNPFTEIIEQQKQGEQE